MRVHQWTKNVLVFAALVFAQELGQMEKVLSSLLAFAAFCAASSATYIFNDLRDLESDRKHPEKCKRPIASGEFRAPQAILLMLILLAVALGLAWLVRLPFVAMVASYLVLTLVYTAGLKHVLLVDVLCIAIGFVIRAMAGAVALDVGFSNWLVVCTLFLALFLALSKRRHEIALLGEEAVGHREVLRHYNLPLLDSLITIVAGAALITYTIYTCSPEVVERLGTDKLYLTLPFVVYGLFRYFHLIHHSEEPGGGNPSKTLLTDWPIGLTVLLWGATCVGLIYGVKVF